MSEAPARPQPTLTMPLLWAGAAIVLPLTTLLPLAGPGVDTALHDTYYVVVDGPFILALVAGLAAFSAVYLVLDVLVRAPYPRRLAWAHLGLTCLGVVLIIAPVFLLPLLAEPRQSDVAQLFQFWSAVSTVGYVLVATGLIPFAGIVALVLRGRGRDA